jgi:3-oxoacyl-[acyl-carrier protein] reductase
VNTGKLANKVAIVTGASKGIGAGIAAALGAAGARVGVNYSSDREGAERVARAIIENGSRAITVEADCRRPRMSRDYSKKWIPRSEED